MWKMMQSKQKALVSIFLILFLMALLNLWIIRINLDKQELSVRLAQQLMIKSAQMEAQLIDLSMEDPRTLSRAKNTRYEIEETIAQLKTLLSQENNSGWKEDLNKELSAFEEQWGQDKKYINIFEANKNIQKEQIKLKTIIKDEIAALKLQIDSMPPRMENKYLIERVSIGLKRWEERFSLGSEDKWSEWDKTGKLIRSLIEKERFGSRHNGHLQDLVYAYQVLDDSLSNFRADEKNKKRLMNEVGEHKFNLFNKASKISLYFLENKQPAWLGLSSTIIFLVLMVIVAIFIRNSYRERQKALEAIIEEVETGMERDIQNFIHEVSNFSDGNLNVEFEEREGITKDLAIAMNSARKTINEMVFRLVEIIDETQKHLLPLKKSIAATAETYEVESDLIKKTVSDIGFIGSAIESTANNASKAATMVHDTIEHASVSAKRIEDNLHSTKLLSEKIQALKEHVSNLNRHHEQVQECIDVIDDAAEQTVILSLNAAIQAALADKGGQGFSIVATEMQELAEQIESAMKKTTHHLSELSQGLVSVTSSLKQTNDIVEGDVTLIQEAERSMKAIAKVAQELQSLFNNIGTSGHKEIEKAKDISDKARSLEEGIGKIGSSLKETGKSFEIIVSDANALSDQINTFVLWEDNHAKK